MLILALETSARSASAALTENGRLVAQYYAESGFTHSSTLLPMVESLLSACGKSVLNIDLFATAHGPGSFTGLRIGIATVKGLAWPDKKPCVGVSTLLAMAYNLTLFEGVVCCVMDARCGQVYNANFEITDGKVNRLCEDRAIGIDRLCEETKNIQKKPVIVGDGAKLCYNMLRSENSNIILAPENLMLQSAYGVAAAADIIYQNGGAAGADKLIPVYLRLPQAEREKAEKEKSAGKAGL